MKKHYNLYEKTFNFSNLYESYLEARKGRRYKPEILQVSNRIEDVIFDLLNDFSTGSWRADPYYEFLCKTEVKRRIINAPSFRDRIVHHAIARSTRELFEKTFIEDSYAITKGKGTHRAVKRLQEFIRKETFQTKGKVYVLQCDIHKYYPSMNHEVLKREIRKIIGDSRLLKVWDTLIDSFRTKGKEDSGLPIGALTSQLSANIYLNCLDHYLKDGLSVKKYLRYMDDFIIVSSNKEYLFSVLRSIKKYLTDKLKLELNPKTKILPAIRGVDFAGYRTFFNHILPRKRNIKAAKKRFKHLSNLYKKGMIDIDKIWESVSSFIGYIGHCDSFQSALSALEYLRLEESIL